MAFCTNCGQELTEGAKFCSNCGMTTNNTPNNMSSQRKTVFEGELHKCPNCGEVLESFVSRCPACGVELRNVGVSNSVKDFFVKIGQVTVNEEKVTLIRNFPISNTKEDIFEFIIFASTNVKGEADKSVFNAWMAKFEQCYQKAELLFGNDSDFERIKKIYEQTNKTIYKERTVHEMKSTGHTIVHFFTNMRNPIFGVVFVLVILWNVISMITGSFETDGTSIMLSVLVLIVTYIVTNYAGKNSKRDKE